MRKYILIILILTAGAKFSTGQNLIPNPSFEDTVSCPQSASNMDNAQYWSSYQNTADYFNICATVQVGIPINDFGYQIPHTGNAYAGVFCYDPMGNYREFIGAALTQTLNVGTKYFVSAYISRADNITYSSDHFGFKLSTVAFNYSLNPAPIFNSANYYSSTIVTDSIGWTKISGSFIADSSYQYVILGNFFDSVNTNATPGWYGPDASYYYIDDVCLSTDSLTCQTPTGINENYIVSNYNLYPNPTNQFATLKFNNYTKQNCTLTIYDSRGQVVRAINNIKTDKIEIQKQNLPNGLYFFTLCTDRQIVATGKLVFEQ